MKYKNTRLAFPPGNTSACKVVKNVLGEVLGFGCCVQEINALQSHFSSVKAALNSHLRMFTDMNKNK